MQEVTFSTKQSNQYFKSNYHEKLNNYSMKNLRMGNQNKKNKKIGESIYERSQLKKNETREKLQKIK